MGQTVTQSDPTRGQMFHAPSYFQNREGLWISESFTNRVLPAFDVMVVRRGLDGVTHQDLPDSMNDSERYDELMGGVDEVRKHAFSLDQIADQIDLQPNGEDGELSNNSRANLFDVLVGEVLVVVNVRWYVGAREWGVGALTPSSSGGWVAGLRFFRNLR